jgi:hypothetical protein
MTGKRGRVGEAKLPITRPDDMNREDGDPLHHAKTALREPYLIL